ncbi:MAG: 4-alpha-glucanotransferase [Phycisphaeraceae bacterium]|nr:4-alpha-glucanotransferase [Phycisphaeraceae bacterium]
MRRGPRSPADSSTLERLAAGAGVLTRYVDGLGVSRTPPTGVVRRICEALVQVSNSTTDEAAVTLAGARSFEVPRTARAASRTGVLVLEDGGRVPVQLATQTGSRRLIARLPRPIPLGVHRLLLDGARQDARVHVLARPRSLARSVARSGRRLAVFLPLHAVSPGGPFGIGTYSDLKTLCDWAEASAGALVGTLPLFPSFMGEPFDPSPYAPVSRLMWNELFVDPSRAPEWTPLAKRGRPTRRDASRGTPRRQGLAVDYRRSWSDARRTLSAMASIARQLPQRWTEVVSNSSAEAVRYAQFRALVDSTRKDWRAWPASWRSGRLPDAKINPRDVDLYVYAQYLAAEQIAALKQGTSSRSPLYLDLPIGVHAGGFDTLTRPDLFLHGFSAGAPPDALNADGQVWGFPPMHPLAGRADGYSHLRRILRRMLSIAGVIRIDHVMGLYRMFCVPIGHAGTDGAYIRYPEDELFAVVMIEAARAGAIVVGEDLGTVPPPVRRLMKRRGLLGMYVQQFAFDAKPGRTIAPASRHALASLNTHDTPTFAGFWNADDVTLRHALGHLDGAGAARERAARSDIRRMVAGDLRRCRMPASTARDAAMSLMRLQARGPALLSLINLEDLWGERLPQNVPGTSSEYPNWRRLAARSLPTIVRSRAIAAQLSLLRAERRATRRRRRR